MLTAGVPNLPMMSVVLPNLWRRMHEITDLPVYHGYAERIANRGSPYPSNFQVVYLPLAAALSRIPCHTDNQAVYGVLFNVLMWATTEI